MKHTTSYILLALLLIIGASHTASALTRNIEAERPAPKTAGSVPLPAVKAKVDARMEVRGEVKASTTEMRKDKVEDVRAKIASSTEARKEDREEMRSSRLIAIRKGLDKMVARFVATVDREAGIKTRIDSRIEKIKIIGGDVTTATQFTTEAGVQIASARTGIADLKTAIAASVATSTVTDAGTISTTTLVSLRKMTQAIEKSLVKAHTSLEKALGALKKAEKTPDPKMKATTTVETKTKVNVTGEAGTQN